MVGPQPVESRPLLTAPAEVLTLILADGAADGRGRGLGVLGATGRADEMRHDSFVKGDRSCGRVSNGPGPGVATDLGVRADGAGSPRRNRPQSDVRGSGSSSLRPI